MTLILNSPETFAAESLAGFVAANATRVRPAPGGVVRSTVRTPGKVAVVVGGGSGHYPAFAGSWARALRTPRSAATCSPPRRPAR